MKVALEHDVALRPAPASITDLPDDPHMQQRQIFFDGEHPHAGPFTYVGQPAVIEGQTYSVWRPAPLLGEHTRDVLGDLGVSAEELDALADRKVI